MPEHDRPPKTDAIEINLRNPGWAAFWAWLWPGAGHYYQRRYAKGSLFMACILGTFFFGLALGDGHVVYASWNKNDWRWQYICQLGVGAAALPALVQSYQMKHGQELMFGDFMAPPKNVSATDSSYDAQDDELARWHHDLSSYFDLGTLFTVIAGLLNVLAIYDAYAGPVIVSEDDETDEQASARTAKKSA